MGQRNPNFGLWKTDDWSPSDASYRRCSKNFDSIFNKQTCERGENNTSSCTSGKILHMFRLQEAEKLLVSMGQTDKLEIIKPKIASKKYWVIEEDEELLNYLVNTNIIGPMSKKDIIAFLLFECYGIKKEDAA